MGLFDKKKLGKQSRDIVSLNSCLGQSQDDYLITNSKCDRSRLEVMKTSAYYPHASGT